MTLLKTIPMLLLVAFLFSQCTGKSGKVNMKKPEEVTLAFVRSFSGLDFEKAKLYSSPETQQLVSMMEGMMAGLGEDEQKKIKAESKQAAKTLKKANCKIEGEMAYCTVCCGPDGTESPEPTTLKRIDGKWYVHIDKNAMGGEGGDE